MRIVLLDLEQTVIDDWEHMNALPENITKIRWAIRRTDCKLGLMSWAVWNEVDKETFKFRLQGPLEEMLGMKFSEELIFSMHDFSDIILKRKHKWVTRDDMFDLYGKEECLLQLLRLEHFGPNARITLIDDVVDHNLEFAKGKSKVRFINVDDTNFKNWNIGEHVHDYGSWRE